MDSPPALAAEPATPPAAVSRPILSQFRAEPLLVFFLAVAVGVPFLNQAPFTDELTHVLAARGLLQTGVPEILPGGNPYFRGWGITYLVAGLFRLAGESLAVARLPSLVFGALLATTLFVWIRSEVGRIGAWFAALLLVFSPISLQLSLWIRPYTLYTLLVLIACLLVYRLLSPPVRFGYAIALAIAAAFILVSAEPLTGTGTIFVASAGLGLWVLIICIPRLLDLQQSRGARISIIVLLFLLAGGAAVGAWLGGFFDRLIADANYADLWAEADRYNLRYYHDRLMRQYPPLWVLFPLAAVIAVRSRRKAALLCICVFVVAFIVHSLAASKSERFLFYAMPMFFGVWGIALGSAIAQLRPHADTMLGTWPPPLAGFTKEAAIALVFGGVILYPTVVRPAALFAVREVKVGDASWTGWGRSAGNPDWVAAQKALESTLLQTQVVIASDELYAYWGLGRIGYMMRRAYTPWQGILPDFALYRGIVPVVATEGSLARIITCNSTGLVFVERRFVTREWTGIPPLLEYLDARLAQIQLPEDWGLIVYRWESPVPPPASAECDALPPPSSFGPTRSSAAGRAVTTRYATLQPR